MNKFSVTWDDGNIMLECSTLMEVRDILWCRGITGYVIEILGDEKGKTMDEISEVLRKRTWCEFKADEIEF